MASINQPERKGSQEQSGPTPVEVPGRPDIQRSAPRTPAYGPGGGKPEAGFPEIKNPHPARAPSEGEAPSVDEPIDDAGGERAGGQSR